MLPAFSETNGKKDTSSSEIGRKETKKQLDVFTFCPPKRIS
jgi:hypothetical protein